MSRRYLGINVLEATKKRVEWIYDNYEHISVSVSSGKDSTVLYYLMLDEAIKRNRSIEVFFLDQEAEYQASIDLVEEMMQHSNVVPMWYQVPIKMKNATDLLNDGFFYAWEEGKEHMRRKHELAIHEIDEEYPQRFYPFLEWYEGKKKDYALVIGLRAEESLNRYRTVTKHKGEKGILWSTRNKYYPLYDWRSGDIWKYLLDNNLPYNRIYQKMWLNCVKPRFMRVSNLIHDISYKTLAELQIYEADTFNRLCKRNPSIHSAGRHARDEKLYSGQVLPSKFSSWLDYRNYLVSTLTIEQQKKVLRRYEKQGKNATVYRQQVKELLVNDIKGTSNIRDNHEEKERLTDSLLFGEYEPNI